VCLRDSETGELEGGAEKGFAAATALRHSASGGSRASGRSPASGEVPEEHRLDAAEEAARARKLRRQSFQDNGPSNMFIDSDAMRAKVHENIAGKEYNVTDLYHETGVIQAIAKSSKFGSLTLVVITLNACWMGLDAECNNSNDEGRYIPNCPAQVSDVAFWITGENMFCMLFTLELLIRFLAFASKCSALRDGWFKFDSVLVALFIVETWILPVALSGNVDSLDNLAPLRMLRLLRLTRMVRLLRSVPELVTLVKGMAVASHAVLYTLLLLVMILYIFSIIFKCQLESAEDPRLRTYFSSVFRAMWTLFLAGVLLDNTATIGELLMVQNMGLATMFLFFILVSSLMVYNMLIGVLCTVVAAVASTEKEKALVTYVKSKLMTVLDQLDEDKNGTISREEFDQLVDIPEAITALGELGVDIPNLMSLADFLFEEDASDEPIIASTMVKPRPSDLDDRGPSFSGSPAGLISPDKTEGEGKTMTFSDFLEMVIRLRPENQPAVANIVELRKLLLKGHKKANARLELIDTRQTDLTRMTQIVRTQIDDALDLSHRFTRNAV